VGYERGFKIPVFNLPALDFGYGLGFGYVRHCESRVEVEVIKVFEVVEVEVISANVAEFRVIANIYFL
jgi:hypothetical protein